MKPCIITIKYVGHNNMEMDMQTNGTPKASIIGALDVLRKKLAEQLVEEARQQVGDNPDAQARWIDLQRQQPGQN